MSDDGLLHYAGNTYDPDDLDYEEVIEVRRIIRVEMWDEDRHGPFDWKWVDEYFVYPATVTVFMQREDPEFTVAQALKAKVTELTDEAPPTKPAPKKRAASKSAAGASTPAASGPQS